MLQFYNANVAVMCTHLLPVISSVHKVLTQLLIKNNPFRDLDAEIPTDIYIKKYIFYMPLSA